jgi:hypothetical protein
MSDDKLRVPGYVDLDALYADYESRRAVSVEEFMRAAPGETLIFRMSRALSLTEAKMVKAVIEEKAPGLPYLVVDSSWTVDSLDAAAQRAYAAFWGVLGPASEQWAVMSDERRDCWRGVVRAVLGE